MLLTIFFEDMTIFFFFFERIMRVLFYRFVKRDPRYLLVWN